MPLILEGLVLQPLCPGFSMQEQVMHSLASEGRVMKYYVIVTLEHGIVRYSNIPDS